MHLYPSSDRLKITLVTKFSGDFRPVCRGSNHTVPLSFNACPEVIQKLSRCASLSCRYSRQNCGRAKQWRQEESPPAAICIYRNCICSLSETSVAKSRFIVLLRAEAPEQLPEALAVLLLLVAGVAIARRRLAPRPEVASALLPPTVEAARLDAGAAPLDLRARAVERATQDPATAALVLRFWLGTTDSELKA